MLKNVRPVKFSVNVGTAAVAKDAAYPLVRRRGTLLASTQEANR